MSVSAAFMASLCHLNWHNQLSLYTATLLSNFAAQETSPAVFPSAALRLRAPRCECRRVACAEVPECFGIRVGEDQSNSSAYFKPRVACNHQSLNIRDHRPDEP